MKTTHVSYRLPCSIIKLITKEAARQNKTITSLVSDQIQHTSNYYSKELTIEYIQNTISNMITDIGLDYSDNDPIQGMIAEFPSYEYSHYILNTDFLHSDKQKRSFRFSNKCINQLDNLKDKIGTKTLGDTIAIIFEYCNCSNDKVDTLICRLVKLQTIVTYIKVKYYSAKSNQLEREVNNLWLKAQKIR